MFAKENKNQKFVRNKSYFQPHEQLFATILILIRKFNSIQSTKFISNSFCCHNTIIYYLEPCFFIYVRKKQANKQKKIKKKGEKVRKHARNGKFR